MGSAQSVIEWTGIASNGTQNTDAVSAKAKIAFDRLSGHGDVEVDAVGAVALLEELAKQGDSEAMWMLGLCLEYGVGTQRDIGRAVMLYNQSCEAKNVVGEFLLKNEEGGRGSGRMVVKSMFHER